LSSEHRSYSADLLVEGARNRDEHSPYNQQNAGTGLYGQATLSVIYAATPSREISHPDSPAITNLPMTRPCSALA
jgi:hypothetical protein